MGGRTSEGLAKAKNKRRGVLEQQPGKGKSKRDRPITVMHKHTEGFYAKHFGGWRKMGVYRDMPAAEQAIRQYQHKHSGVEFQIIDKGESDGGA